jgi:RimJ/RimL family protein N-acetyltransferase
MTGRFCLVEPLDPDAHAEPLFDAFQVDAEGRDWTYLPYGPFASLDDFATWLQSDCTQDDPLLYTIIEAGSGMPVGLASYLRIQPDIGVIEVGHIHYSPRLQRTAAATEAMYLMMSRAFDELGYRRYEWKCDALSQPSRNAAQRLGFSFEGIFRQATICKGRNRDTAWYSVTDQTWPSLKKAYLRWLRPENLDEQGQQRQRLAEMICCYNARG